MQYGRAMDDIDAALDGALELEEGGYSAGYTAGGVRGAASGHADGIRLGYDRGRELGQELGRMLGRVEMLQAVVATQPQRCPERVRRVLGEIRELLPSTPPHPLDEAAFEAITEARAKIRMVDAWLGGFRPPAEASLLSF